jgi:hypothetical protein
VNEGDKPAFNRWKLENQDKWERFVDWFGARKIKITTENAFNMAKY